jgi:hypothetical protein
MRSYFSDPSSLVYYRDSLLRISQESLLKNNVCYSSPDSALESGAQSCAKLPQNICTYTISFIIYRYTK